MRTFLHEDGFNLYYGTLKRGLAAFDDIGRADFPLDPIADDVRAWRHEVADGRGLFLLRGFPVDRWSQEEAELVWFGLGTHFGRAVSQSVLGDLLGHVVNVGGDDMRHRAYRNARELRMHTDRCDTVGMFCLCCAKSDGESGYSSAGRRCCSTTTRCYTTAPRSRTTPSRI